MTAAAAGAEAAVATSAGTTGLHLSLLACGVLPGDLVVLPSFTFIASANAISHCGATPWLMDVDAGSWTLNPALLADELRRSTAPGPDGLIHVPSGRRVSAILVVYTLGMPADMDRIMGIAEQYGLPVVADAAAALGADYKGRNLGSLGPILSVFSFNGNKTVTCGGGGAVVGAAGPVLDMVRHLSGTARIGSDYTHDRVGFNYRMTNVEAAVGCAQMENLDRFVTAKRDIHRRYNEALIGHAGLTAFPDPEWANSACWFSGVIVPESGVDPVELRRRLNEQGIEARPFWKPLYLQQPYKDVPCSKQTVSEGIWSRIVTLPCSTGLSRADQDRVINAVLDATR